MSVKIRQPFHVTDGIGVEDGQHSEREREREREREDVDDSKVMTMRVVGGRLGRRRPRTAAWWRWSAARVLGTGSLGTWSALGLLLPPLYRWSKP
jgi:hypothetical protein